MTRSAQTGTVQIHRLGSSAQPLTPTRTCSFFPLPDLVALSGLVLHHESAPQTGRNIANVQLQILTRASEVWKKNKNPPQNPVLECAIHAFARRESFFLFKLQPKRRLQWVQAVTEPHPSNSCQSNMRTENRGMDKTHQNPCGTSQMRLREGSKKAGLG